MLLSFGLLALPPAARAILDPPPDGGYADQNTAEGTGALYSLVIGSEGGLNNTGLGFAALSDTTTGDNNTAAGASSLEFNITGNDNTATGAFALASNTTGNRNVATGSSALYSNQVGTDNTATGVNALYHSTASYNTATGYQALESNTTGNYNTAHGLDALNTNTTGSYNTANGALALFSNTVGIENTADGEMALYQNTTGSTNTALGQATLANNTTGFQNTAVGTLAASNLSTGSNNIAVGFEAGINLTTGSNNIDIGNAGVAGESAKIRIGTRPTHKNTYIAGVFGVTVPSGVAVLIDNSGHLGTATSSERFKEAIKPMENASETILALKPVMFRYKHELDPGGIPQFGLVAEEVEKVNPDLVARDDEGKPYTVRYEAVNAMLLNEFLKQHRKVEELDKAVAQQQSTNTELRKEIAELKTAMREQAAEIRKASDEATLNRSTPQMVASNQ
jgi:hypothetical protein